MSSNWSRFWTLINLRNRVFSEEELIEVYKTFVSPVADYCDVVYHPILTDEQDELIENLQNLTLKLIYGPWLSARKMRSRANLTTLRQRRIDRPDSFAAKAAQSDRFASWFPMRTGRSKRGSKKYHKDYARRNGKIS